MIVESEPERITLRVGLNREQDLRFQVIPCRFGGVVEVDFSDSIPLFIPSLLCPRQTTCEKPPNGPIRKKLKQWAEPEYLLSQSLYEIGEVFSRDGKKTQSGQDGRKPARKKGKPIFLSE